MKAALFRAGFVLVTLRVRVAGPAFYIENSTMLLAKIIWSEPNKLLPTP